jgi:hypothetical protein
MLLEWLDEGISLYVVTTNHINNKGININLKKEIFYNVVIETLFKKFLENLYGFHSYLKNLANESQLYSKLREIIEVYIYIKYILTAPTKKYDKAIEYKFRIHMKERLQCLRLIPGTVEYDNYWSNDTPINLSPEILISQVDRIKEIEVFVTGHREYCNLFDPSKSYNKGHWYKKSNFRDLLRSLGEDSLFYYMYKDFSSYIHSTQIRPSFSVRNGVTYIKPITLYDFSIMKDLLCIVIGLTEKIYVGINSEYRNNSQYKQSIKNKKIRIV